MAIIHSFAESGFYTYGSGIITTSTTLPLIVEAGIFARNAYQNPQNFKERLLHAKHLLIYSFTPQTNETGNQAILRIAKNACLAVSCLGLMAVAIYFSILLLPSTMAISVALSSIYLIGKLFVNAGQYKQHLIENFTRQSNEDLNAARKRIAANVVKTALCATITIGIMVLGAHVVIPLLTQGFSWSTAIPFQTKGVVFAEYALIGLINAYLAYTKYKKGDKAGALFHLFTGALSFIFPSVYLTGDMRLHHSFYGLIFMTLPFRATRFLGSLITFDSSLYFIAPTRNIASTQNYDFINLIVDNFSQVFNSFSTAILMQAINTDIANADHVPDQSPQEI